MDDQMQNQLKSLPEWFKIIACVAGEVEEDGVKTTDAEGAAEPKKDEHVQCFTLTLALPDGSQMRAVIPVAKASRRTRRRFAATVGRTLHRPKRGKDDAYPLHTLDFSSSSADSTVNRLTPYDSFWILQHNQGNRVLQDNRVERYFAEHHRGQWYATNQGIGFDSKGNLIDGQHRLIVSFLGDFSFETNIVWGLDPRARTKTDTGAPRSAADVWDLNFRKSPSAPTGQFVTSTCLALLRFFRPERGLKQDTFYVPIAEQHEEGLNWLYNMIKPGSKMEQKQIFQNPLVRAAFLIAYKGAKRPATIDDLAMRLARGANIQADTTEHILDAYLRKIPPRQGLWVPYWILLFVSHIVNGTSWNKKKMKKPNGDAGDHVLALIEEHFGGAEKQIPLSVMQDLSQIAADDEQDDEQDETAHAAQ
jgi:hypothetical protein